MDRDLNKRSTQIIMTIVPIALAGVLLFVPFVWRALRTKRASDIKLAIVFGVVQVVVYGFFWFDPGKEGNDNVVSDLGGAVIWGSAFIAAFVTAWVYRPLTKREQAEQARDSRPGSSYL